MSSFRNSNNGNGNIPPRPHAPPPTDAIGEIPARGRNDLDFCVVCTDNLLHGCNDDNCKLPHSSPNRAYSLQQFAELMHLRNPNGLDVGKTLIDEGGDPVCGEYLTATCYGGCGLSHRPALSEATNGANNNGNTTNDAYNNGNGRAFAYTTNNANNNGNVRAPPHVSPNSANRRTLFTPPRIGQTAGASNFAPTQVPQPPTPGETRNIQWSLRHNCWVWVNSSTAAGNFETVKYVKNDGCRGFWVHADGNQVAGNIRFRYQRSNNSEPPGPKHGEYGYVQLTADNTYQWVTPPTQGSCVPVKYDGNQNAWKFLNGTAVIGVITFPKRGTKRRAIAIDCDLTADTNNNGNGAFPQDGVRDLATVRGEVIMAEAALSNLRDELYEKDPQARALNNSEFPTSLGQVKGKARRDCFVPMAKHFTKYMKMSTTPVAMEQQYDVRFNGWLVLCDQVDPTVNMSLIGGKAGPPPTEPCFYRKGRIQYYVWTIDERSKQLFMAENGPISNNADVDVMYFVGETGMRNLYKQLYGLSAPAHL